MPILTLSPSKHLYLVESLAPFLWQSLATGPFMDPALMKPEDVARCKWVGYGISKAVTDHAQGLTIFGDCVASAGLHGELVQSQPGIDPLPLCYDDLKHRKGFGSFTRWVWFAGPKLASNVLGLDFSLAARPTGGVANSMLRALRVIECLQAQGIPPQTGVALLNWHMCQDPGVERMLKEAGLLTVADWINLGTGLFSQDGGFCPRCGLKLPAKPKYCPHCGCQPDLIQKECRP